MPERDVPLPHRDDFLMSSDTYHLLSLLRPIGKEGYRSADRRSILGGFGDLNIRHCTKLLAEAVRFDLKCVESAPFSRRFVVH